MKKLLTIAVVSAAALLSGCIQQVVEKEELVCDGEVVVTTTCKRFEGSFVGCIQQSDGLWHVKDLQGDWGVYKQDFKSVCKKRKL